MIWELIATVLGVVALLGLWALAGWLMDLRDRWRS